ncbi:MAG: flagellar hook basal-body protein [Verrucomicrobia bacterium]|nr:flagellar hook basal-body protein [Verrucomicrobiota bacterium]
MVEGIFTNAAALNTLEKWQATISQNLAAANVAGFKKANFAVETDERKKTNYEPEAFAARHQGGMPTRTTSINFSPGDTKTTGKPTDFAIDGPGFFQIEGANNLPLYTRDGEFHINQDNILVTKNGLPVLTEAGQLAIDPDEGPVTISQNGNISQGNNELGRLVVYNFEDTDGFTRVEGGYFEAPEGADPQVAEDSKILQGAIESSNVAPMAELVSLIAVSRAYEAAQRSMSSHDDLINKAIQSLGTTA